MATEKQEQKRLEHFYMLLADALLNAKGTDTVDQARGRVLKDASEEEVAALHEMVTERRKSYIKPKAE